MSASGPVMVAMSGGVDSSVAAALLLEAGHDVVGVTMKLWGGPSDSGCCSVSDVDDARWVADHLGIDHHVFNFGEDFEAAVVGPYVADHAAGLTPNPCIECNRHLKFDRLLRRAEALGFASIATGHHARVVSSADGLRLARGVDIAKDQAYVLHMLDESVLARLHLPIGDLTKSQVRAIAERIGLATANKPDSQDVCFITAAEGRRSFIGDRIGLTPATVVDTSGVAVGSVESVELVTIGQRRGLGLAGGSDPRYVVDVDTVRSLVTVGGRDDLLVDTSVLGSWRWVGESVAAVVDLQVSAHGAVAKGRVVSDGATPRVEWDARHRRVAAGQSIVAFVDDVVVGGGTAA